MKKGFTLVEILVVVAIIGILVVMVLPSHKTVVIRSKEAVLKENLFQIRDAINKYYYDKKKYPPSLEELVTAKYLRRVPEDPFLRSTEWHLKHFEPEDMEDFDPEITEGIIDICSLNENTALDGSKYNEW
ncbi:MAG: prepilin-type N-terminal cleavage/methylation domain-containing protein [Acidobacteria bacterium]|jgi:general secretion pathway protein G|nr:prepilin-type N-terminal cleavage/methylation domain-containing protein [Acidobacteriota bacterium]